MYCTYPSPPSGEEIRNGEDEEEPIFEIVEPDWSKECDSEVGETPYHDGNCGALSARRRWVDFRGDQPDLGEPADAE